MGTAKRRHSAIVPMWCFLINGIPVAVVETKSDGKSDGLSLGVEQIRRYHNETPEMFTTAQLFGVTQLLDFFYGVTWNTSPKKPVQLENRRSPLDKGGWGVKLRAEGQNLFRPQSFPQSITAIHYLPEQRRPTHQNCVASAPDAGGGEGH